MKKQKRVIFKCPTFLDIYHPNNYEKSLKFIFSFETLLHKNIDEITISFVHCRELKAAAFVIFYSKIEQLLKQKQIKINIHTGINFKIITFLKRTGFYQLCQSGKSSNNFTLEHLPIISGQSGEYRDDIIDFINQAIYKNQLDPNLEYVYGDAIQEAINNVSLHAYQNRSLTECRWWLSCSVIDDELYLVLYDQGKGIPETFTKGNAAYDEINWNDHEWIDSINRLAEKLGRSDLFELTRKMVLNSEKVSDSISIFFAMSDDITRMTGKDELKHGQGSKSIKKLVSDHEDGILWIYSNHGLFKYQDNETLPFLIDYPLSIQGTLIQWNIKVFV